MDFVPLLGSAYPTYPEYKAKISRSTDYALHPARYRVKPFRIFGNLYYVGDAKVCAHLIDTGDGLVLFDSGYPQCKHLLIQSVWELGFNPKDIRYVIHSHCHFDHFGCSEELREMFGSKLCISRVDGEALKADPGMALLWMSPDDQQQVPEHDILLEDGQIFTLGSLSVLCKLAPGHTPGTMAFFFDITEGDKTLRVGYFGGVGFNTQFRAYWEPLGLPDMQKVLRETVKTLRQEKVDICIANHPRHNRTVERRQAMLDAPGTNPFLDPTAWTALLDAIDTRLDGFMERGL